MIRIIRTRIDNYFHSDGFHGSNRYWFKSVTPNYLLHYYSVCFYTLSQDILLEKLNKYGERSSPFDLIKSYFTDRKQYVIYDNKVPTTVQPNLGSFRGQTVDPSTTIYTLVIWLKSAEMINL